MQINYIGGQRSIITVSIEGFEFNLQTIFRRDNERCVEMPVMDRSIRPIGRGIQGECPPGGKDEWFPWADIVIRRRV